MKSSMKDTLSTASVLFDIFTALLSVVDVVSDLLVAHQFYSAGHMAWFWMVMASLILSNVVYAGLYAMIQRDENSAGGIGPSTMIFIKAFILIFPVAQAVPLWEWYRETYGSKRPEARRTSDEEHSFERQDSWDLRDDAKTTAAKEELDKSEAARQLLHRMNKAFTDHMRTHRGFYVETVVESIPQSVIQLIAVTALGEATPVQLVSMCLSLFSIVSKAYIVAAAFDARVSLFKMALVAHDVFSMFYLFSTISAKDELVETTVEVSLNFFGYLPLFAHDVHCSQLTALWLKKAMFFIPCYSLLMIVFAFLVVHLECLVHKRLHTNDLLIFSFVGLCGLVLFFPAMLAFEGAKLLPLVMLLELGSHDSSFAMQSIAFTFWRNGDCAEERKRRLRHILATCRDAGIECFLGKGSRDYSMTLMWQVSEGAERINEALGLPPVPKQRLSDDELVPPPIVLRTPQEVEEDTPLFNKRRGLRLGKTGVRASLIRPVSDVPIEKFTPYRLRMPSRLRNYWKHTADATVSAPHPLVDENVLVPLLLIGPFFTILGVSGLINFFFPLTHVACTECPISTFFRLFV